MEGWKNVQRYYVTMSAPCTLVIEPRVGGAGGERLLQSVPMSVDVDALWCPDAYRSELMRRMDAVFGNKPLMLVFNVSCKPAGMNRRAETEFRATFDMGSALREALGDTARIQVKIYRDTGTLFSTDLCFSTQEMPMMAVQQGDQLVFVDYTFNEALSRWMREDDICSAEWKMDLLVVYRAVDSPQNKLTKEETVVTDAIIIPSNGTRVKCNQSLLAAHSDVIQAMFAKDTARRIIKMPEMSEDGVRALLNYLSRWDLSKAEGSCPVAVELLMAAHKYNIEILEREVRRLFLSKPEVWYDVDAVMKLFFFVYGFDGQKWNWLKKKVVMIFKRNTPDLKSSATVQQLFRENPDAAIAFCQFAISI